MAEADSTYDVNRLNRQAKRGIRQLMVREAILLVLTFAGGVILARVLDPADFGVFGITLFLVNVLALFGDCGLAPSFIQRKKELTDLDLRVGFTVQQVLITSVVVVMWFLAPWVAGFYPKAPDELVWLTRALAFNLYLQTWRSISVLQLERKLHYKRLAAVEVVEKLSFQVVAVTLAVLGFGVWSLIWAVLARGLLGTVLVYGAAPWTVRLGFDRKIAREILRFGLPFQFQRIISDMKEWVTPTLVAALIGPDAVGFLMWGSNNGHRPMRLFGNVIRVLPPHVSRLQDNQPEVERILSRYQVYFLAASGLWFSILVAAGYHLTAWIYTEKWLPAVPVLMLAGFLLGLSALNRSTKRTLIGLGQVWFTMRVTLVNTVLNLILGVTLVLLIGFIGVPVAALLSLLVTLPWLYRGLQRGALRRILRSAAWISIPVIASILTGLAVQMIVAPLAVKALGTTAAITLVYLGVAWLVGPDWLKKKVEHGTARYWKKLSRAGQPVLP